MVRIQGNTYTAEVTSEDRLKTDAKAEHPAHVAAETQNAYIVVVASDPSATDADFFYLKNTSSLNLKIHKITMYQVTAAAAAQEISIKTGVTGTPTSGVAIVPINLFTGGKAADVTCEQKDGDMALTGGSTVDIIRYETSVTESTGQEIVRDYQGPITLPPDTAMVFNNSTDPTTTDIDMSVHFYFEQS